MAARRTVARTTARMSSSSSSSSGAGAHLDTHVRGSDARVTAKSAERNAEPIWAVLERVLPPAHTGAPLLLEIASGCGLHASLFGARRPDIVYQPTEYSAELLPSIAAWSKEISSVRPPVILDVAARPWSASNGLADIVPGALDIVLNVNMVHISPFTVCEGLFAGAGETLKAGGAMVMYGPFVVDGVETAASNLTFDATLRERDASWGLRSVETELKPLADAAGLVLEEAIAMPANNFTLVWRKA